MGLDIYLYRYKNFEDSQKREQEYESRSEEVWNSMGKKYDNMPEEERDKCRIKTAAIAKELKLGEWGTDDRNRKKIEIDSKKYPEHLFKIGYFRSSYNNSGFNSVVKKFIGKDLYDIFDPGDRYQFQPNWKQSLDRAVKLLEQFKANLKPLGKMYSVEGYTINDFINGNSIPTSEEAALKLFRAEVERWAENKKGDKHSFDNYSNRAGNFHFGEPLKVLGIIPGRVKQLLSSSTQSGVYVIYEADSDWYRQAIEVVIEAINWVLKQPDHDKYYLHWSS